jgi:16S rRNA processing protein RimM
MDIESCIKIGWILKPHGLKGEVTVMLERDAPEDLSSLESVFIEQNSRLVPYFVQHISDQAKKAFVKLEDVNTADEAAKISKHALYIEKSLRPKSGKGEFYNDEVVDFEVHEAEQGHLGNVREIMQAGPNRLLVVIHQGREVLIPVNGPFITSVNKTKKRISVTLPEGFLDI